MESSNSFIQNAKNKRRLVQQNIKLRMQVKQIEEQIELLNIDENKAQSRPETIDESIMAEINKQQKQIKQLRNRIEQFKLQRAKDNVQYIIHEEDDLKILKKVWRKMVDEKEVLMRRKDDKNDKLKDDIPYQAYQSKFLEGLMEIVHHNREQGSKITEVERQIRKYHLLVKKKRLSPSKKMQTPQNLQKLQQQISQYKDLRKKLEDQWKPHLNQLDEQNAKLLHQLSIKKEQLTELERQQRIWDTRMLTVRDPQQIFNDKKRIGQVIINPKLKQKLQDYLVYEQQKKNKKKVNYEQLKYQFKSVVEEQPEVKKEITKITPAVIKKIEDKVTEILHNDKNITKKIEKQSIDTKKVLKVDQTHNTQISLPPNKKVKSKKTKDDIVDNSMTQKYTTEQRGLRLWQNVNPIGNPQQLKPKEAKIPVNLQDGKSIIRVKEISISTDAKLWQNQNI